MLIDTVTYRRLTGDSETASATVEQAITDAQTQLEDALGRRGSLELGERTETVPVFEDGTCYPSALPIVSADGVTVHGDTVYGAPADQGPFVDPFVPVPVTATITYVGGIDPDDCPGYMAQDLAWAAYELVHGIGARRTGQAYQGATSVRLGDAAVSYGAGGYRSGPVWSAETMRHRRQSA